MASPITSRYTQRRKTPHAGVSRKRTLSSVGAGLVLATPLLSSVLIIVEASRPLQHRVGAAQRHVSYPHVVDDRPRDLSSKFFMSIGDHRHHEPRKESEAVHLEFSKDDPEHLYWSLVADATHQRRATSASRSLQADEGNLLLRHQNQRREQVSHKFVEDSTSAVLHGQSSSDGADGEEQEGNDDFPVNLHENYAGYNVTSEVYYNLSSPSDEGDGSLEEISSSVLTSSSKLPDNLTSVSNSSYTPIRIRAVLSDQRDGGQYLTGRGLEVLLSDIIQPALVTWSAALRVEPVVGSLTVDQNQLFDNQTCGPGKGSGLPSPRVPSYHFTTGVPDSDLILYLSVGFAPGAFHNWTGFVQNATNETEHFYMYPNETESKKGENRNLASNENDLSVSSPSYAVDDLMGLPMAAVESKDTQPWMCAGDFVAAASYCSTDQYDRPTAGMLHICIDEAFFSNTTRNKQIMTIMHEVGHVLGFNARSMAHFRRPNGVPITPRVNGEIVETLVQCTGPTSKRRFANVTLPSEEILQFKTVRNGVRVAEVVTESVAQVTRNHFDCQNLTGAELESLPGDADDGECIGDHWERRLFQNDLMNPVVDFEFQPFISTLTLAFFADSGWYQVDLSMAELAASWGRAAGCGFVQDTCIGEDGRVPASNKPFFCDSAPKTTSKGFVQEIDGCTADLYRKAACSLGQYDTELPPEYQYFGSLYDGTVGGSDPFIDYCPTYAGFDNGLCSSMENAALLKVNNIERFGERNSRCLSGMFDSRPTALCLPIACVVEDRSLHVKVDGVWRLCESRDQELKVLDGEFVVCPDPRRVCPTFYCHHDCLGTSGRCDYDTGACVCGALNETNALNETMGIPADHSTNISGVCRREQIPGKKNRTLLEMPHEDSPLSDYYVPFKESLRNDQSLLLTRLQLAVLLIFLVIIAAATFWYFQLQGGNETAEGTDESGGPPIPPTSSSPNPNKDKMIATVLVDMRMNSPDEASVAPTADTTGSLYGLDSAASANSSPGLSSLDHDDRSSLASEDVIDDGDVLRANATGSVRKRRFQGRFIKHLGRD